MLETPDRPASPLRWPLVGRREQLEWCGVAMADPACDGLLICGPAGVGKSRLAEECAALARAAGRAVGRATASATTAELPLAALAHLLPFEVGDERFDPVRCFEQAAKVFDQRRCGGAAFVLVVDDLPLLDVTSTSLVVQLVDAGVVFLIGTARTGQPLSDVVAGLWRSGRAARVDLADLSRDGVDTLLHLALGGPVAAGTVDDLWAASRGNPLYLRELVLGADAAGTLAYEHAVWRLTSALTAGSARLIELVEARLGRVDGPALRVLDVLALAEPVGAAELEQVEGIGAVETLERAGLVRVELDGRRQEAVLAHPLYGEVLRRRMPASARRRLLVDHADRVDRRGARRREDPLRVATWRLEATGHADPGLLLAAARLARYGHDFELVRRLAGAALPDRPSAEASLLLGEALFELGSFDDAEAVLAAGSATTSNDDELVRIVAVRVRNLLWGLLRPGDALAINDAARHRLATTEARDELIADEASVQMFSGHPREALRALNRLGDMTELRTRVLRAVPEAPALAATGRCETALWVAERAFAEHLALGDELAIAHPGTHVISQVFALAGAGRIEDAIALATTGLGRAVADRSPIGRIWFTLNLGRCHLLAGRMVTARRWLAEADGLCRRYHFDGPRKMVLAALAVAVASVGDAQAALSAVDDADRLGEFGFLADECELGRAWAAVAADDPQRGREVLVSAASAAAASGHRSSQAWLLHDLARLGAPGLVCDALAALAEECEGALVAAYAGHARAAAAGDPDGLVDAAERFEGIGTLLLAAEAAVAAAQAYRRAGQQRAAAALSAQADALAGRCEGARTPGLVDAGTVVPLTRREQEVATLAVAGLSNQGIADRLYLSVRTVETHLANSYVKLGVAGRGELAGAINAVGGSPDLSGRPRRRRPSSPPP